MAGRVPSGLSARGISPVAGQGNQNSRLSPSGWFPGFVQRAEGVENSVQSARSERVVVGTPISSGCALLKRPYFFRPFRFGMQPLNHISVRKPTKKAANGHRINKSSSEPFPASGET